MLPSSADALILGHCKFKTVLEWWLFFAFFPEVSQSGRMLGRLLLASIWVTVAYTGLCKPGKRVPFYVSSFNSLVGLQICKWEDQGCNPLHTCLEISLTEFNQDLLLCKHPFASSFEDSINRIKTVLRILMWQLIDSLH